MTEASPADQENDHLVGVLKRIFHHMEESEQKNVRLHEEVDKMRKEMDTMRQEIGNLKETLQRMAYEEQNRKNAKPPDAVPTANLQWRDLWESIEHKDAPGVRAYLSHELLADPLILEERVNGYTPLEMAAAKGYADVVSEILHANPFSHDVRQRAIHMACQNKHLEIVKMLVDAGVHPNLRDDNDVTPLMCAAKSGSEDIVRFLVDSGADATSKDKIKHSALHDACASCSLETVQLLVEHGAEVNVSEEKWERTPLYYLWMHLSMASVHSSTNGLDRVKDITLFLLENGADPSHQDINRDAPLFWAFKWHVDIPMLRMMVENSKNLNITHRDGRTPLHYAIWHEKTEIVRLMLERGANKYASCEENGRRFVDVLSWAQAVSPHPESMEILKKHHQK